MKMSEKLQQIYDILLNTQDKPACSLNFKNPYQLLIAVVLSAQCKDERVNKVTPAVFNRYPDVKSLAESKQTEFQELIKSIGFATAKSTNLIKAAKLVCQDYNAEIPKNIEDLVMLSGVGRKSANVILGNAFNVPGFPVDTHVTRVLNRIGIVTEKRAEKIEAFVNKHLDSKFWIDFSHLLISHGRAFCTARKPNCIECELEVLCRKKAYTKK